MTEVALKPKWREALGRPYFLAGLTVFWVLRWVVFQHTSWVPTHTERLINLAFLLFSLAFLAVPMLLLDRSFKSFQKRMLSLGADQEDMALLARSVSSVLSWCYVALYLCVFALTAPR